MVPRWPVAGFSSAQAAPGRPVAVTSSVQAAQSRPVAATSSVQAAPSRPCSSDFERTGGAEQGWSGVFEAGRHQVW